MRTFIRYYLFLLVILLFTGELEAKPQRGLEGTYTLGFSLVGAYLRQGGREIETGSGVYKASVFDGFRHFFQAYYEWPLQDQWQGRLFLNLRRSVLTGDAQIQGGVTGTSFEFQEKFIGGGVLVKHYFERRRQAWAGVSIEYSDGQEVTVTVLNGTPLSDDEASPPRFMIFSAHMGYDWPLREPFYLVTEGRIGTVVTTNPFTLLSEVACSGVWSF